MLTTTNQDTNPNQQSSGLAEPVGVKFESDNAFQNELKRRVNAYFVRTGRRPRDCWQMYLTTGILLTCCITFYALLVFFAPAWWMAVPLGALLAMSIAAVAFNVPHDGAHRGYSERPWVNAIMASMLDCGMSR